MAYLRAFLQSPTNWWAKASGLCYLWAWVFWYLFFVQFSYGILGIGIGLGGALYPLFYTLPVLVATLAYQLLFRNIVNYSGWRVWKKLLWTVWIPFLALAAALVLFAPIDSQQSYLQVLWTKILTFV